MRMTLIDLETRSIEMSKSVQAGKMSHEKFYTSSMEYIEFLDSKLDLDDFIGSSPIFHDHENYKNDGKIIFKSKFSGFIKMFTYDITSKKFLGKTHVRDLINFGLKYGK